MGNNSLNRSSLGMLHPMVHSASPDLATQPAPHQTWSNVPNLRSAAMAHPNTLSPSQSHQHRSAGTDQVYSPRPQELQLFPGTSSSPERECSPLRSTPTSSSSLTDSLPGQLRLSLPQSPQEGSASSVSRGRKERKNG
uniref:Uncharacterized protein n=1 Tax=Arundo donax TaxID=35708 RepID=A0A0A9G1D6_ARUDO